MRLTIELGIRVDLFLGQKERVVRVVGLTLVGMIMVIMERNGHSIQMSLDINELAQN